MREPSDCSNVPSREDAKRRRQGVTTCGPVPPYDPTHPSNNSGDSWCGEQHHDGSALDYRVGTTLSEDILCCYSGDALMAHPPESHRRPALAGSLGAPLARSCLAALLAIPAAGCRPKEPAPPEPAIEAAPTTDVEELHALAKVYGYVRFFHPSDAAAAADWDLLVVRGARQVVAVEDRAALHQALKALLKPVAPAVVIYPEGTEPPAIEPEGRGRAVAW